MNKKFKIVGKGSVYNYLKEKVELIKKDDLLIIVTDDLDDIKEYLLDNYKYVVLYSELTLNDIANIDNDILFGFINGKLDDNPLILYGGNKETYDYIEKLSNNNRYYKNKYETAILNESIVGIHYTYLLAYYVGLVLSKKYDFDLHTYLSNLVISTPELCQGAYRNIWSGLADDNSYEDVDDVIHGMEMLVCLMKKTSGKEMIFANAERKLYLNKLLSSYWNKVSSEVDNG